MSSGMLPGEKEVVPISPIFTGGDEQRFGNYGLISLTSEVVKLLEREIKGDLMAYLSKTCSISDRQQGSTVGRSCLSNVLIARKK